MTVSEEGWAMEWYMWVVLAVMFLGWTYFSIMIGIALGVKSGMVAGVRTVCEATPQEVASIRRYLGVDARADLKISTLSLPPDTSDNVVHCDHTWIAMSNGVVVCKDCGEGLESYLTSIGV